MSFEMLEKSIHGLKNLWM